MKWCGKCEQFKSPDDFYKNRTTRDGRQPYCKRCWKQYDANRNTTKTCMFEGCSRVAASARYCVAHRKQIKREVRLSAIPRREDKERVTGPGTQCSVGSCGSEIASRGMCQAHYRLWKLGKPVTDLATPVPCDGCGSDFVRRDRRTRYCHTCLPISTKMRSYGLEARDWYRLLDVQGGACAICGDIEVSRFHVDHDHDCCAGDRSCGRCVRGLLCHGCNIALGGFRDDPVTLVMATVYLQRYAQQTP